MAQPVHPVLDAVRPLLDRIGAVVVGPAELRADDVPLVWGGEIVAGIRLAPATSAGRPDEHSAMVDAVRQSADPAAGPAGRASDQSLRRRAGAVGSAAGGEVPGADVPGGDVPGGDVPGGDVPGGLEGIIAGLERSLGTPLAALPRSGKQQAVRLLEESGAFSYRKSVEMVAAALGVSRFTVYNYLNRDRD